MAKRHQHSRNWLQFFEALHLSVSLSGSNNKLVFQTTKYITQLYEKGLEIRRYFFKRH